MDKEYKDIGPLTFNGLVQAEAASHMTLIDGCNLQLFSESWGLPADDPIIRAARYAIHDPIECREHSEADQRGGYKETGIRNAEQQKHLTDHREGEGQVQACEGQRQHKHHEQLGADAPLDFRLCHAHLLHDLEALDILVALGNLLVVDYQHGSQQEHDAQHDANEEHASVGGVEIRSVVRPAGNHNTAPSPAVLGGEFRF